MFRDNANKKERERERDKYVTIIIKMVEKGDLRPNYYLCAHSNMRTHIHEKLTLKIIIMLHGLGRLTCSGIDALPSFRRASTISSSSRFVVEGVIRQSGVGHSFKMVDPVLFVFGSHVLYSRDL